MISEKEWKALPEDEKQRRRKAFEDTLTASLNPHNKKAINAAVKTSSKEKRK